ncbi:hypothetical protein D9M68_924170 [compost metagenome]
MDARMDIAERHEQPGQQHVHPAHAAAPQRYQHRHIEQHRQLELVVEIVRQQPCPQWIGGTIDRNIFHRNLAAGDPGHPLKPHQGENPQRQQHLRGDREDQHFVDERHGLGPQFHWD